MKLIKLIFVLVLMLFISTSVYAADDMTVTYGYDQASNLKVVKIAWTDSPSLTLESQKTGINAFLAGWSCYLAETIPGSGGAIPDDNYDIVITNTAGTDIFGTALTNRSQTSKETALPLVDGGASKGPFPIKPTQLETDALTVTVTGQTNANGTGVIYLYFARY